MTKHNIVEHPYPVISLDGVAVIKGDTTILQPTTLDIPRGFTSIVGPNGSGKSTLLDTMYGRRQPALGTVRHLDIDGNVVYENAAKSSNNLSGWVRDTLYRNRVRDKKVSQYRSTHLGYIPQRFELLPDITGKQAIEWVHQAQGNDLDPGELDSLMTSLQLNDRLLNQYPDQQSGGQLQRLTIASALAHGPDLIFADEPRNQLDSAVGPLTMQLLRLKANEGASVICVSHSAEDATYADTVITMRDGVATIQ